MTKAESRTQTADEEFSGNAFGHAQRTWFPEMIVLFRSEWYQGMAMPALISLRGELQAIDYALLLPRDDEFSQTAFLPNLPGQS